MIINPFLAHFFVHKILSVTPLIDPPTFQRFQSLTTMNSPIRTLSRNSLRIAGAPHRVDEEVDTFTPVRASSAAAQLLQVTAQFNWASRKIFLPP